MLGQERMKGKTVHARKSGWEKGKLETFKKRLSMRKVWEQEWRRRGEREAWRLIRVNDVENPPIRAFSCVAG